MSVWTLSAWSRNTTVWELIIRLIQQDNEKHRLILGVHARPGAPRHVNLLENTGRPHPAEAGP
jgi:hypothetical protein